MGWFKTLAKELFTGNYDGRFESPPEGLDLYNPRHWELIRDELDKRGVTVSKDGDLEYKTHWYEILTGMGWGNWE